MIINKTNKNLIYSFTAFICLVYLTLSHFSTPSLQWLFFNADTIYVPYLYWDLINNAGKLSLWKLAPVPYFFPDGFIYFILQTLTNNFKVSILLFAFAQLCLYYFLVVAIGNKATKEIRESSLYHLSILLSLLLLAGGYLQQETLNFALVSQEHFGTALMFLLGTFLILKTFSSNRIINFILLFFVCIFTLFSDLLFITQFVVTAIATLCVMAILFQEKRKIYLQNILTICISSAISYYAFLRSKYLFHLHIKFPEEHLIKRFHINDLVIATKRILFNLSAFYEKNAIIVFLLVSFIVLSFTFLFGLFFKKIRGVKFNCSDSFAFVVIMLLMSVLTGYCSLIFLDNDLMAGSFFDSNITLSSTANFYVGLRHYQPFILFPVFLGAPLLLTHYTNLASVISRYYGCIILAILFCGFAFTQKGQISDLINFYPEPIACLDRYAQKYHLENGAANYWEAKSYTLLSKQHLTVVAIDDHAKDRGKIEPEFWMNTKHDYLNRDIDFLIVKNNSKEYPKPNDAVKAYGKPIATFQCPPWNMLTENMPDNTVYVYKRGVINSEWSKELNKKL